MPQAKAPLSAVREALAEAVEGTSLRNVARQAGVSPTTLRCFLDGRGVPYFLTRERLMVWYKRHSPEPASKAGEVRLALEGLLDGLEPVQRRGAALRLLDEVGRIYLDNGSALPGWLPGLQGALAQEP